MKIHCALPTRVFPNRIRAEKPVLRPLLGIIFACTGATQVEAAYVTPAAHLNSCKISPVLRRPPQKHSQSRSKPMVTLLVDQTCLHDDTVVE